MHWRTDRRRGVRRTMGHLKGAKEAWCKICTGSAVEDARHYMCQCPNDLYVQVRKKWYKKASDRMKNMSMKLREAFIGTVELKHGMLADGDGQGVDGLMTAWDATSGRIPILWSKAVAEDGIDDDDYKTFLRWYGERLHKELWQPMWVERSREMAKMMKDGGNS